MGSTNPAPWTKQTLINNKAKYTKDVDSQAGDFLQSNTLFRMLSKALPALLPLHHLHHHLWAPALTFADLNNSCEDQTYSEQKQEDEEHFFNLTFDLYSSGKSENFIKSKKLCLDHSQYLFCIIYFYYFIVLKTVLENLRDFGEVESESHFLLYCTNHSLCWTK